MDAFDDEIVLCIMGRMLLRGDVRPFLMFSATCSRFRRLSFSSRLTIDGDSWHVAMRTLGDRPNFGLLSVAPHIVRISDIRWRAPAGQMYGGDEENTNKVNRNGFDLDELIKILARCHIMGGPSPDQKLILDMTYMQEWDSNIIRTIIGHVPRLSKLKIYRPLRDRMVRAPFSVGSSASSTVKEFVGLNIADLSLWGSDMDYRHDSGIVSPLSKLSLYWTGVRVSEGSSFPRLLRFNLSVNCGADFQSGLEIIKGSPMLEELFLFITCSDGGLESIRWSDDVRLERLDRIKMGVGWDGAPSGYALEMLKRLTAWAPNVRIVELTKISGVVPEVHLAFPRLARLRIVGRETTSII